MHEYLGPFAAAAWMLKERIRSDGSPVSRLMFPSTNISLSGVQGEVITVVIVRI